MVGDGFKNMQILIDLNSKYLPGILNPLDHILHLPSNVVWSNIPTFASPTKLFAWETIFIVFMVLSFAMCTQNVFSQMQEQRFREMVIFGTSSPVYISQSWKSTKVWFLALAPLGVCSQYIALASIFSFMMRKIVLSVFIFVSGHRRHIWRVIPISRLFCFKDVMWYYQSKAIIMRLLHPITKGENNESVKKHLFISHKAQLQL